MIFSHFINYRADFSIEIVEQNLLIMVVFIDLFRINAVAFLLNSYDIFEKIDNLMISRIIDILWMMRHHSCLPSIYPFWSSISIGDPTN